MVLIGLKITVQTLNDAKRNRCPLISREILLHFLNTLPHLFTAFII